MLVRSTPIRNWPHLAWQYWSGPALARISRVLVITAAGLLFLQAAGTIDIVFTLRPSQILVTAALVLGLPCAWQGWRSLPRGLGIAASVLLTVYAVAMAFGEEATVAGQARSGSYRDAVYLLDLLVGLGTVGLVPGLWKVPARAHPLAVALVVGAVLAAAYAIYQPVARSTGFPLADINNALNTDGVTRFYKFQGEGLFGLERVRGTFSEPKYLAFHLASLIPLIALQMSRSTKRVSWALSAASLMAGVLLLTASIPAWAVFLAGAVVGLLVYAVGRGWVVRAVGLSGILVMIAVGAAAALSAPAVLSQVTGRSAASFEASAGFRTQAWTASIDTWKQKPALGYGPGQSAVQLADSQGSENPSRRLLGSAQGLWSAALIDTGLLGVGAWTLVVGGSIASGVRAVVSQRSTAAAALLFSLSVTLGSNLVAGDRLDLRSWLILGLTVAMARGCPSGPHKCKRDG